MSTAVDKASNHRSPPRGLAERTLRFLRSPSHEKSVSVALRLRRWLPRAPVPLRLSFGAWWIAQNSDLDGALLGGSFESNEIRFVQKFLRPGMMVLDVGAHHGFYTLLASKKVGRKGRVIAFEPSPRERRRLSRHVKLNFCRNVRIEPFALGAGRSRARLYVVEGREDWCNSLRPPAVSSRKQEIEVEVLPLDEYLRQNCIETVDLLKIDVEGGERDVLRGACDLLAGRQRPVILAEVQDIRTEPWGYRAREIIAHLRASNFAWFRVRGDGFLEELPTDEDCYDGNFVAVPRESLGAVCAIVRGSEC
jgi:FkbM family methyltransferase